MSGHDLLESTGDIPASFSVPWYRIPLPREQLEALNRRSDRLGLAQSLGYLLCWAGTASLCVVLALQHRWWWLIAALQLHGMVASFCPNAVHELVHGTVFRTAWLNGCFARVFAFLSWGNHHGFWASHQEHHLYTLHHPHDQEEIMPQTTRQVVKELLGSFIRPLWLFREIPAKLRAARGILKGQWQKHLLDGQERRFTVFRWARILLIGHALIAAVSLWYGLWIVPVVVSMTPAYGWTLQYVLNKTQHLGRAESVADFRVNCRTIRLPAILRFFYWHMNWHIEHHMYAAVPCYRLAALHRAIAHELPPTTGLFGAWFEIAGILWRQQREPGWKYFPSLPGAIAPAQPATVPAPSAATAVASERRRVWRCTVCGFIYDEALGLPEEGIDPGTAWNEIPADWRCPDCGIAKRDFAMVELLRPVQAASTATTSSQQPIATAAGAVVIVGSGLAGYTLARELRRRDSNRPITLITRDGGEFVSKPQLSNALADGLDPDSLVQKTPQRMAGELGITVRHRTAVTAIDTAARELVLGEERLAYGELVLALGADQVRLPIAGDGADRVLRVNDLDDYRRFRAALPPREARVLILGAGLIGCEFADDLRQAGHRVTLVDLATTPLAALLPVELGRLLRSRFETGGVSFRLGTSVQAVDATADGLRCRLASGEELDADVVLSAVGLRPRTALAVAAGIPVNKGITVDACLRSATDHVFALGDCAEIAGAVRPYILPLMAGARALARTLAGEPTAIADEPMPVVVKTPSLPLKILPAAGAGTWQVDTVADGAVARYRDAQGRLIGWALAGAAVATEAALLQVPEPALDTVSAMA